MPTPRRCSSPRPSTSAPRGYRRRTPPPGRSRRCPGPGGRAPGRPAPWRRRRSAPDPTSSRSVRYSSAPRAARAGAVARPMSTGRARDQASFSLEVLAMPRPTVTRGIAPHSGDLTCDARPPGHPSALSHSRSTTSSARAGSVPRPTKAESCDSVIAVVATRVRTSAEQVVRDRARTAVLLDEGRRSGRSRRPRSRSSVSRIWASVFCATVQADMIGSLVAKTVAALPTIRLAKAAGVSPASRGA